MPGAQTKNGPMPGSGAMSQTRHQAFFDSFANGTVELFTTADDLVFSVTIVE